MKEKRLFRVAVIILGLCLTAFVFAQADYDTRWVTYENQQHGYSLEYPQDWIIDANNPIYVTLNSPENEKVKQNIEPDKMRDSGYMPDITIAYYSSVKGWGAETLEEVIDKNSSISNAQTIYFAGTEAYEMIMGGSREGYMILCEYNGHLYQIGLNSRSNKADLTKIEKRILESFQFK